MTSTDASKLTTSISFKVPYISKQTILTAVSSQLDVYFSDVTPTPKEEIDEAERFKDPMIDMTPEERIEYIEMRRLQKEQEKLNKKLDL